MATLDGKRELGWKTHVVHNQAPPLINYNLYSADSVLQEAVRREGADWAVARLFEFGQLAGTDAMIRWANQSNEYPPVLHTHNRYGERIDEVEFHPAWHELMKTSIKWEMHSLPWVERRPGAHVARAALMFLDSQNETGHGCPISMTYSVVPALRWQPDIAELWLPWILTNTYDCRFIPADKKSGVIFGMGMTEKQGGSDVRANSTRAVPASSSGPGQEYLLTGHKWFCSAPMSDAFLVLAQAKNGLSCFLLPRWTPDGQRNRIGIQRLKDKLGNRSNASSEVEFDDASAYLIGEEGQGTRVILDMVNHTRLDCSLSSAALMRQALVQAVHHIRYRHAFGKRLIDQPLMVNVAADLALESEAATILFMRLARAYDDEGQSAFRRIATAIAKYWLGKRAPQQVCEALECLGGNGYVEESMMPRLYREAPLSSIWEGSGNVICLDVLRAIRKEPDSLNALMEELNMARGRNHHYDQHLQQLAESVRQPDEQQMRSLVEEMALLLQAGLLLRHSPDFVAEVFCKSRLEQRHGTFGCLPAGVSGAAIVNRAMAD